MVLSIETVAVGGCVVQPASDKGLDQTLELVGRYQLGVPENY